MFLKRLNMLHSIGTYTCGSANVGIWYSLGDEKFWNQEGYESTLCLNAFWIIISTWWFTLWINIA